MRRTETADDAAGDDRLDLAFTLCARLTHDLAGTVGALAGTLDMVGAEGDVEGEEGALALARDCARELTARIRLLRVAWGTDGAATGLSALVAGLPAADRLQVELSGLSELDETHGRLAANLLLLAAHALPRGGIIRLSGNATGLELEVAGPRAGWPAALERCLRDPSGLAAAFASHRDVGVAVTCRLAERLGLPIMVLDSTRLTARPS